MFLVRLRPRRLSQRSRHAFAVPSNEGHSTITCALTEVVAAHCVVTSFLAEAAIPERLFEETATDKEHEDIINALFNRLDATGGDLIDKGIDAVLEALALPPPQWTAATSSALPSREVLPMYYLKMLDVGPRILTIEACRYLVGGCMTGCDCRFSHL